MKKLKCCGCKLRFPADTMTKHPSGNFCTDDCAISYAQARSKRQRAAIAVKKIKQEKKSHSAAKRKLKDEDRSFQLKKTQDRYFNPYIRLRDRDLPCVSCGRSDGEIDYSGVGGKWDCGHYKTRGAFPELRFDERNAAKQCKKCNGGSGKYSRKGRSVKEGFDIGMLERYGQERLDWLNGPHEAKRYTIANLKTLQRWFKRKTKRMENEYDY